MNLPTSAANKKRNVVNTESNDETRVLDQARMTVYQFLSLATSKPSSARWQRLLDPGFQELTQAAVEVIRQDPRACPDKLAPGELPIEALELAPLLVFLRHGQEYPQEQDFSEEFDHVFGLLISRECPPYETEYCPQTFSIFRSHQLADIAGYYRAFGLQPANESPERHDHISLELEFMAWLNTKALYALEQGDAENASICRETQVQFVEHHLAWWTTAFALALRKKADGIRDERDLGSAPKSLLGAIGVLLAAFIPAERAILGIASPTTLMAANVLASVEQGEAEECRTSSFNVDTNFE